VDAGTAAEVAPNKLAQVVAAGLLVEPVRQPAWLMRNQYRLVVHPHALVRYPSKVPAQEADTPDSPPSFNDSLECARKDTPEYMVSTASHRAKQG
jgi:hypothetical protein